MTETKGTSGGGGGNADIKIQYIIVGGGGEFKPEKLEKKLETKPFDHDKALAGKPVVTADGVGIPVTVMHYDSFTEHYMVYIEGSAKPITVSHEDAHNFYSMLPVKVKKYLNVYKYAPVDGGRNTYPNNHQYYFGSKLFNTEHDAKARATLMNTMNYVKTIEIEEDEDDETI